MGKRPKLSLKRLKQKWDEQTISYLQGTKERLESINMQQFKGQVKEDIFVKIYFYAGGGGSPIFLEAGCGSGKHSAALSILGFECHAVDFSMNALKSARFFKNKVSPRLNVIGADICHLPYRSGSFDVIFNEGVIEHMDFHQRKSFYKETYRTLRKGGTAIFFVPNHYWRITLYPGIIIHENFLPYYKLKNELERVGFKIFREGGVDVIKSFLWWPMILRRLWNLILKKVEEKRILLTVFPCSLDLIFGREVFVVAKKD